MAIGKQRGLLLSQKKLHGNVNDSETSTRSKLNGTVLSLLRNSAIVVTLWGLLSFDTSPFMQSVQNSTSTTTSWAMVSFLNTSGRELTRWADETYQLVKENVDYAVDSMWEDNHNNDNTNSSDSLNHKRSIMAFLQDVELQKDTTPVYCFDDKLCCGRWNVNADSWWLHHPDWEPVQELEDPEIGFCFSPLKDTRRREMMQQLHRIQWGINITDVTSSENNTSTVTTTELSKLIPASYNFTDLPTNPNAVNCSDLVTTVSISSGYGASLAFLYTTFWYAWSRKQPFQIVRRGPWMYAQTNVNHTWAYCPDKDVSCLYLPVSPCDRVREFQPKLTARANMRDPLQALQWLWLREYMTRPNQGFRHEMARLKQRYLPSSIVGTDDDDDDNNHDHRLEDGCIAIHVRRGDAGVPRKPFRRYAAIQEYLDLLPNSTTNNNHNKTQTIFLLTDDATTIDELHQYHLNTTAASNRTKYRWVYTHKTRSRGTERGFDGHIPTASDGPEELVWITVEQELAARYCHTLVNGISGYANILSDKMRLYNSGSADTHYGYHTIRPPMQQYGLNTAVSAEEAHAFQANPKGYHAREAHLLQNIQAMNEGQTQAPLPAQ